DDGLAPRDGTRPEDPGSREVAEGGQVRDGAPEARQGAAPRPTARREARGRGARSLRPREGAGSHGCERDRAVGESAITARARGRRRGARPLRRRLVPAAAGAPRQGRRVVRTVAYYKGCLAALSAKELDTSTQALAPKVGLELIELEAVTCCGAGDIHEAEPDYYLHLNARILAYAEETGADTLMTICNVCTLNLRQANHALQGDAALRDRVNENLVTVGAPPYSGGVEVMHFLWLIAAGEGYELLQGAAHKGLKGLKIAPFYGCQIL